MRKLSLKELNRTSPEAFKEQSKTPIIIILDNIRSGLNVGSAFRTSDAFALQKIYLCGITAQPPHREILKTAIGASQTVDWEHRKDTAEVVQELKTSGIITIAVEQTTDSVSLADFKMDKNQQYAFIFGNEVSGVSDDVLPIVHTALEIPQFGTKHSLNISVCMGIVVWEGFRQLPKS